MKIRSVGPITRKVGGCIALVALLFGAWTLHAADLLFQFDTAFPANPDPAGPAPWVVAYFQDVSPGTVRLTISNVNLAPGEFIGGQGSGASGGLFFNLNPNLDPAGLVFALTDFAGSFTLPTIQAGTDSFKADGDGLYDIRFDFATSNPGRFVGNDSVAYMITGVAALAAADFNYLSKPAGENGPFFAAAHIMGLSGATTSAWIEPSRSIVTPVPEPGTTVLVALGGLSLVAGMRRRHPTQSGR